MRVLHTNCDYIWTKLHQLMIKSLERCNIHSTVFSPVSNINNAVVETNDQEIVKICFSEWDKYFFHYKQKKILHAITELLSEQSRKTGRINYDILHAYYLFVDGYYTRKISKKYKIPYVVAVRNTDVNVYFKRFIHLRSTGVKILLDASAVFFLSDSYLNTVVEKYIPQRLKETIREKSIVIPNGIDAFWLENPHNSIDYQKIYRELKSKKIRLIFAGGIDKNKNVGLIIQAMKLLHAKGWEAHLDIVGPILDKNEYDSAIKKPNVSYTPKLTKERLIQKYRESHIFVMPSHTESFGLVYAEAMSQGLPVIYTRGQGFDKQFDDGLVGYSVNDHDAVELCNRIILIAENYIQISKNCLKNVEKFNWDNIAKRYDKIYSKIVIAST